MLHIADVTAAAVERSGCVRVGLLGTRATTDLASSIYAGRLRAAGVEVSGPAEKSEKGAFCKAAAQSSVFSGSSHVCRHVQRDVIGGRMRPAPSGARAGRGGAAGAARHRP